ncbi:MAG: hypothetical protein ACAH80_08515 [Alphaproteobacteria bacterium]
MSEQTTPATPPPQTPQQPAREVEVLDTLAAKILFSFICFISPAPLAIVLVDFWLRFQGKLPEHLINPIFSIKQGVTGTQFATIWPLLVSILPAAVILMIIFHDVRARVIMLALLLVASLLQFTALAQFSSI